MQPRGPNKYEPFTERTNKGLRVSFLAASKSQSAEVEKRWYVKEINQANAEASGSLFHFIKQEFLARLCHSINPDNPKSKFLSPPAEKCLATQYNWVLFLLEAQLVKKWKLWMKEI